MDKPDRFYALVRHFGRFCVWFFFRSVDVQHAERVPPDGPVLLCINHPNNLIDSLLVGAVVERTVHYLTTAALFRNALVRKFLRACGAIPVYRRQDDPDIPRGRRTRNHASSASRPGPRVSLSTTSPAARVDWAKS